MVEPLVRIIEGSLPKPRIIEIDGCRYYITPEAAKLSGGPRGTMD